MIRWVRVNPGSPVVHCTTDDPNHPVRLVCMRGAWIGPVEAVPVGKAKKGQFHRCQECVQFRWDRIPVPPLVWMLAVNPQAYMKHVVEGTDEFGPVAICGTRMSQVATEKHLARGRSTWHYVRGKQDTHTFEPYFPCDRCMWGYPATTAKEAT